jgi:hypothetical protein
LKLKQIGELETEVQQVDAVVLGDFFAGTLLDYIEKRRPDFMEDRFKTGLALALGDAPPRLSLLQVEHLAYSVRKCYLDRTQLSNVQNCGHEICIQKVEWRVTALTLPR